MSTASRILCAILIGWCVAVVAVTSGFAGGIRIIPGSVEVNGGIGSTARPGQEVSVDFVADMFSFGSDQYGYVIFAVIPENQSSTPDWVDAASWRMYGFVIGTADREKRAPNVDARFKLKIKAPGVPGKFKILYHALPMFTSKPVDGNVRRGETFERTNVTRDLFAKHVMSVPSEFKLMVSFSVGQAGSEPVAALNGLPMNLYLQANGQTPGVKPVAHGTVERPLVLSWYVSRDFKLPSKNISYRYQMITNSDDWSEWSSANSKAFFFLPKGLHEFSVQARYQGNEGTRLSPIARYSFRLAEPMVAQPSKEALTKAVSVGPIEKLPVPDMGKVYSGSRAILFGIYNFDDFGHFPTLPEQRIRNDIKVLKASLEKSGFQVETVVGPRITTQDVRLTIDNFVKTSKSNERIFIYFSTHGFPDPSSPANGFLATSDCKFRSASATCLPLSGQRQQLDEAIDRNVRQIVIAVDSCFAGLGVVVKSPPEVDLAELGRRQGIHMLTAGMEDQKALIDNELGMSTFTHFLAKGLDGEADIMKTGVMSLTELFLYVQYAVAQRTKSSQIPMMGRIRGSGEMLFQVPNQKAVRR